MSKESNVKVTAEDPAGCLFWFGMIIAVIGATIYFGGMGLLVAGGCLMLLALLAAIK